VFSHDSFALGHALLNPLCSFCRILCSLARTAIALRTRKQARLHSALAAAVYAVLECVIIQIRFDFLRDFFNRLDFFILIVSGESMMSRMIAHLNVA